MLEQRSVLVYRQIFAAGMQHDQRSLVLHFTTLVARPSHHTNDTKFVQSDLHLLVDDFPLLDVIFLTTDTGAAELLLLESQFAEDNLVCASGWNTTAEQAIHGLERNALGLRYEEEDEDRGAEHEGGEEHVDAEAH